MEIETFNNFHPTKYDDDMIEDYRVIKNGEPIFISGNKSASKKFAVENNAICINMTTGEQVYPELENEEAEPYEEDSEERVKHITMWDKVKALFKK